MTGLKTVDVVVLGAGISGLSCAYRLAKAGKKVLVLEKDAKVGGLAKTLTIDEFQFDYCAHRFHSPDPAIMKEMAEMMGDNWVRHLQKSRILLFEKFLKYPFELQNLLRAMPKGKAMLCILDFGRNFIWQRIKKSKEPITYKQWFCKHFGPELYKTMCEPYTRKIWGMDPDLLSADWADQRFQGPNLRKLIKRVFQKLLRLDFSSYDLQDESLAPDAGAFYYPKHGGIQAMSDRFAEITVQHGSVVETNVKITEVHLAEKRVVYTNEHGEECTVTATDAIVSTVPLHTLVHLAPADISEVAKEALQKLRYMDIIFVLLFVKTPRISNDTWLYFPNPAIAFNRSVEFKNWSDSMAPADRTSLCLDITVTPENDHITRLSDEALVEKCKRDCEDVNLCAAADVYDWRVYRIPYAYPVYDLEYRPHLTSIIRAIESHPGVFCIGRTGIFRYQNTDGAIDMGFRLAERMLDPGCSNPSLFEYSMKGVSY